MKPEFIGIIEDLFEEHRSKYGMTYVEAIGALQMICDDLSERCRKEGQL